MKTIIDFGTELCMPCKRLEPDLERVERGGKFHITRIDAEKSPLLVYAHGVTSLPTLILIEDGKELDRVSGSTCAAKLREWEQREVQNEHC